MRAGVLFSGGKDSALAALLLARDYDVELNSFVFDTNRVIPDVQAAADAVGLPFRRWVFKSGLLETAVEIVIAHGYPNQAITMVHKEAIAALTAEYSVVGDGTRLNDRVPKLTPADVQHIEARTGCSYVRPLLGFGKTEVERLAQRFFTFVQGDSETITSGDYEHELRAALREKGLDPAAFFPPHHDQSLVRGRMN